MNQKELNELRRRFRPDRSSIRSIYGCYVSGSRQIISWIDAPLGLMPQEEQELYLGLLKKSLSGTLGKNLIDIVFSSQQVADSDEHRLLQTLRRTALQDRAARETLCQKIINAIDLGGSSYLILLAADAYDVPHRGKDGRLQRENADEVFQYIVCSVCPVKTPSPALSYCAGDNEFHQAPAGQTAAAPELGFLFPAFDDRTANIYNALFYTKNAACLHQEVIAPLFCVEPPMSAAEQKEIFDGTLRQTLEKDCSYDVIQSVHEQLRTRIEAHRESKDPEPLTLSVGEVARILTDNGVPAEKADAFRAECERQYGPAAALNPDNLIERNKFEVTTQEAKLHVAPENSSLIEARVINGRKYILIPADAGVSINGVDVTIPLHP